MSGLSRPHSGQSSSMRNPREPVLLSLDDDSEIGAIIDAVARKAGFAPTITQSTSQFYINFRLIDPDVIVLDLQLGSSDGIEVLRLLADTATESAIILVSGMEHRTLAAAEQYARARGLNLLTTVHKPFLPEDLLRIFLSIKSISHPLGPADFERAMTNGDLRLHFQPVIRRLEGVWNVDSVEALLRWEHPERGTMKPSSFLKLGEAQGLSRMVTDFVIETGLAQLKGWLAVNVSLRLRVNISSALITDLEFPDRLHMALQEFEIDPAALTIELNETAMFAEEPGTFDILTRLRLKGFGLAIDDFGIGYSSLTQLFRMPFSEMKIDRALMATLETSQETRFTVDALIDLAHKLGLEVCAEGVEDVASLNYLADAGCDSAQGYLISRPIPSAQIPTFMLQWEEHGSAAVKKTR